MGKDLLLEDLRENILGLMPDNGILTTDFPGLRLVRKHAHNATDTCLEKPFLGVVIQGIKTSLIGGREYTYQRGQSIVGGVDMPIASHAVLTAPDKPFLFLYLELQPALLIRCALQTSGQSMHGFIPRSSVSVAETDDSVLEMLKLMLGLLTRPWQIAIRGALMAEELHYLLLTGSHGAFLRQLYTPGTHNHQLMEATSFIRKNFSSPIRMEELAHAVGSSPATLHRQFKMFVGLTPLQYQKQLRLFEARRLIVAEGDRPGAAALKVGYESGAQFAREYRKLFGHSPASDGNRPVKGGAEERPPGESPF